MNPDLRPGDATERDRPLDHDSLPDLNSRARTKVHAMTQKIQVIVGCSTCHWRIRLWNIIGYSYGASGRAILRYINELNTATAS
jgi:hypothetical protein